MRTTLAALVGLTTALGTGTAMAQDFGESGTLSFSTDRLFGLSFSHIETEDPGDPDIEVDTTEFSLGWRGRAVPTPFEVPRFAFDVFVIDGLSVGGALGYGSLSSEDDDGDEEDGSEFIFAPRVGYVWMFSDVAGFWLRGGFTYHSSDDFFFGGDESGLALTVEPTFVLSPAEHFAFTVGASADFDVTGEWDPPGNPGDRDRRYWSIGIQLGMLGYF
jgi:hypothetical protein